MILVLLGTNPYNFGRLIDAIDLYAKSSDEKIEIQLGNSVSFPKHANFFKFLPKNEIEEKIKASRLVIVHGGYGSIFDCLKHKKKIIAVPRRKELNEALDPGFGQFELVQYLERKNRILALYDVEKITETITDAALFEPNFDFENNLVLCLFLIISFHFSLKTRYNVFPQDSGVYSSLVASAFGFVALHYNPESCLLQ